MNPLDPTDPAGAKPWNRPQEEHEANQPPATDLGGADGTGAVVEGAGAVADGAAEIIGGVADAAGGALEAAGGCLEGCGSCSLAVLIGLVFTANVAYAVFR